jgi:hypothetical protein
MDPQLQRAYDALQQADAAGNKEDAQQIADYIRELQTQQQNKEMLEAGNESMMRNPVAAGAVGAIAGPVAGKVLETAYGPKGVAPTVAPTTTSVMPGAPGQKYAAKTGYGAGTGETVREVVEEFKQREAPLGKGKVTSKIKGTPLGGPAAMEQIAAKEADAARFAQMRAANQVAAQKAASVPGRIAQATAGKMPLLLKSAAGAGAGIQGADAYNRFNEGDFLGGLIGGIGAAGSAASLIPHPVTRIGGTAIGMGAGALNAYLDYLKGKAQPAAQPQPMAAGGLASYAKGKTVTEAAKKLKNISLADLEGKTILGTMSDRTRVGGGLHGGPMFPTIHPGAAWAMDAPGAATRLLNAMKQAGGPEQTIVAPMLMSNAAHRSNRDVAKLAAEQFRKNVEEGIVSPERLQEINDRIRMIKGLQEHPGMLDPNVQNMMDKLTFSQRGQLVDVLGSKPKTAMALDLDKLLRETTEPGLYDEPLGAIGPSVFKLSGERSINPSLHGSYSHILHGEPVGAIKPIPREFLFRDLESKAKKELGRELSDYNYRTSVGIPAQLIDEKLLRSLEELGHLKEGGSTTPAWQRKEGKSPSGGLNALGRASYKRETGGELKAPQPEGGSRKKSFCARMGGMKKKLTSAKTANDPDSRINKALRKWKC